MVRKINWDAIRADVEAGIDYKTLSMKYTVPKQVIQNKSQKQKWATPFRVAKQMTELTQSGVIKKSKPTATGSPINATNSQLQESDIISADPREGYSQAVAYHIAKKVQRALPNMPDPRSWRDLNTADSMARRAMGLDKQVVRAAGIFGGTGSQTGFALEITSNDSLDTTADNAENGWFDDQG